MGNWESGRALAIKSAPLAVLLKVSGAQYVEGRGLGRAAAAASRSLKLDGNLKT